MYSVALGIKILLAHFRLFYCHFKWKWAPVCSSPVEWFSGWDASQVKVTPIMFTNNKNSYSLILNMLYDWEKRSSLRVKFLARDHRQYYCNFANIFSNFIQSCQQILVSDVSLFAFSPHGEWDHQFVFCRHFCLPPRL